MASALDQRLRKDALNLDAAGRGLEPGRKADAFAERKELEAVEEGKDLSAEAASRLQNRLGNQTLASMMNRNQSTPEAAGLSVEIEEEGEDQEVEEEGVDKEDEGVEAEESQRQFGGGGGGAGGGGGGGANPWDVNHLFGDDDDDDGGGGGKPRRRRLRPSAIRNFPGLGAQDLLGPRPPGALEEEDLAGIDLSLGAVPEVSEEDHWGEAGFQAVDAALLDPRRIGKRTAIEPEDLVDQTGVLDPIGRPAEIGRFLADQGDGLLARSLARVLGGPSAALLPPAGGHAGAVARLATLAVCAEALEGGGLATDRAVAVALRRDAWVETLQAAQESSATGGLRAPELLAAVLGPAASDEDPPEADDPLLSPLAGRALARIIPEGPLPAVPALDLHEAPSLPEHDEEVAAVDAAIARMTGGPDVSDLPPDPNIGAHTIAPVLEAATSLVSALGRAQVELAAAALAVRRVHPRAAVQPVLAQADAALRQMARTVIGAGRRVERLVGVPIQRAGDRADAAIAELRGAAEALTALRVWAFSALGGAVAPS